MHSLYLAQTGWHSLLCTLFNRQVNCGGNWPGVWHSSSKEFSCMSTFLIIQGCDIHLPRNFPACQLSSSARGATFIFQGIFLHVNFLNHPGVWHSSSKEFSCMSTFLIIQGCDIHLPRNFPACQLSSSRENCVLPPVQCLNGINIDWSLKYVTSLFCAWMT